MEGIGRLSMLQLAVFRELGRGRTIKEIGELTILGHPSVSKHIHAAERRLGLALVEQRGRRLYLTQAGALVAAAASDVGRRIDALEVDLESMSKAAAGTVRIIATFTPATYVLPPLVEEFLEGRTDVRVVIHGADVEELWPAFEAQGYELAVAQAVPAGLAADAEPLYEDRLSFFVAPGSGLPAVIDPADLAGERLAGAFNQSGWQDIWREAAGAGLGLVRKLDLGTVEAVKRQVESRGGIGVLFERALEAEFASGRFRPVTVAGVAYARVFQLVTRRSAPPVARALGQFLRQAQISGREGSASRRAGR